MKSEAPDQSGQKREGKGQERSRFPKLRVIGFNRQSKDSGMPVATPISGRHKTLQAANHFFSHILIWISPKPQSQTQPSYADAEAGLRQGCFAQGHEQVSLRSRTHSPVSRPRPPNHTALLAEQREQEWIGGLLAERIRKLITVVLPRNLVISRCFYDITPLDIKNTIITTTWTGN